MSVKLWAYEPEKCDGDYCPNNCNICSKAEVDEEHIPIWLAMKMLSDAFNKEAEREDEILDV